MSFRVLAVFLLSFSFSVAADQDQVALQWLDKMNHAMKTLNYHGTVVFIKNGQLDTMKYRHSVESGVEQERLSSLNSPLREVIRKTGEVSCLFKETREKVINHHPLDSSFIINLPQDSASINRYYSLSNAGTESIATLPAQLIGIQPKDEFRYARKIWVDLQHFLPLKVEVYNADGVILEQVVFTDLTVDLTNESNSTETDDTKYNVKHIHATQAEPFENAPFMLKNWPAGFKALFFIRNSLQQSQKAVDHLLISDGFSSVSIYMEPKDAQSVQGLNTLGSVNSFSQLINDVQITVLGEVPAKTVEFIAAGIVLR